MTLICDARIRPFPNDTELVCLKEGFHEYHRSILLDRAYPGSETTLTWHESDRRNFHGEWPGKCDKWRCVLPDGHKGECVY